MLKTLTKSKSFSFGVFLSISFLMPKFSTNLFKGNFTPSNFKHIASQVGSIELRKDKFSLEETIQNLKSRNYDSTFLKYYPNDVCELPNSKLAVASFRSNAIYLYDKNFELYREVTKIGDQDFAAMSLTSDNNETIFISDHKNKRIIFTDLSFARVIQTLKSSQSITISQPHGLCYYEPHLYICEHSNKTLYKYNVQSKDVSAHVMDANPWQVKVSDKLIAVQMRNQKIHLFDRESFTPLAVNSSLDHGGSMLIINSVLLVSCLAKSKFFIYETDGTLREEIKDPFNCLDGNFEGMTYFNEKLVVVSENAKKLNII